MVIEVKNLNFKYKQDVILNDISFELKTGEILALLGANGAGKSTLLKCINKILPLTSGMVSLNKNNLQHMSRNSIAKKISYVPQDCIGETITVFESVLLGRKPYIKWDVTDNDMEITRKVIDDLNLGKLAMRRANELSGGELQKVAIARALAQEPYLLLLDEPTSNLDPKNQIDILKLMHKSVKGKNIASIISVHDLNMALRYADKFLMLKNRKVFAYAKREEVTSDMIKAVYDIEVILTEVDGHKLIIPK